jgi:hypothetical protein
MQGTGRVAGTRDLSKLTAKLTLALEAEGAPARSALFQAVKEALSRQIEALHTGDQSALGVSVGGVPVKTAINTIGGAINGLTQSIGGGVVSYMQTREQGRQLQNEVTSTIQSWYQPETELSFTPASSVPWGTLLVGGVAVAGLIGVAFLMKRRGDHGTDDTR